MTTNQETAPVRPRPTLRTVTVRRAERVTPHVVRVVLGGDELTGFTPNGPAEHIRVWFPFAGQERPVLPEWGPEGPVMPPGVPRPESRVYTPRRWLPDTNELEVDFVVHGAGPGSAWAASAATGSVVVVSGPGGPYRPAPDGAWFLLATDEAGLPAAHTILRTLPEGAPVRLLAEVEDGAEEAALDSLGSVEVTWLHRGSDHGASGRLLDAALRGMKLPGGDGRVWVACEAEVMRDIRRHLLHERGLDKSAVHTHGYWKAGVANHPDHDLGQEY